MQSNCNMAINWGLLIEQSMVVDANSMKVFFLWLLIVGLSFGARGVYVIIQQTCDLMNMNVDGDESRPRLNYYSRSSPKKRRYHHHASLHSPLLPSAPAIRSARRPTRPSPSATSPQSSFRIEVLEVSHSSNSGEILIEDFADEEILIQEPEEDDRDEGRVEVSVFPGARVGERGSGAGEGEVGEKVERSRGQDIRIEDDQNQQGEVIKETPPTSKEELIKIQNQQSQTMNRQFTFGQELAQAQKAEIEVLPLTIPEQEEQEETSYSHSPAGEMQEPPLCESNLEYGQSRPRPELDMALVQAFEEGHDYQSPKFNVLPNLRGSDKWITADHIHLLSSPKRGQILIEDEPKPPSHKSSARTSLSFRPFGRSVALLNEVLGLVPAGLAQVYEQMSRKLVGDQIEAEQRQERQEATLKTLRLLLEADNQGLSCERFLVSAQGSALEERVEANRVIIRSLVRRISEGE